MPIKKRYWDTTCFLGWLSDEKDKIDACQGIIEDAEAGKIKIITSALTIAEVIYLKGHPKITHEKSSKIIEFFKNEYIILINVDRNIAEEARKLLWEHEGLKPADALHVASASFAKVPFLDTFDEGLEKLSDKIGNPLIHIGKPNYPYQEKLFEKEVNESEDRQKF